MNFIPAASPSYWAPASIQRLTAEGTLEEVKFDCHFKRLKKEELDQLPGKAGELASQALAALKPGAAPTAGDTSIDWHLLGMVCLAWRVALPLPEGAPQGTKPELKAIPFAAETLEEINNESPGFMAACVRAFLASVAPVAAAHYAQGN